LIVQNEDEEGIDELCDVLEETEELVDAEQPKETVIDGVVEVDYSPEREEIVEDVKKASLLNDLVND